MNPNEIVQMLKAQYPEQVGHINENAAMRIVRATLAVVGQNLATADEGVVRVAGLGQFRIKNVEREKDGKKENVRMVTFKPLIPKQ